jgi:uncharacterized protein (TIGR02118 family)
MFKTMFFLYRRLGTTFDEFQRYSKDVHVPMVAAVPGVERYVVNHAIANPAGNAAACDAVAELWFRSEQDFQAALVSPEGVAVLGDQANYLDLERTHVLIMDEAEII